MPLVEFFPHKLVEIVVQDKVLEFGQLHGHVLLLDLVQDVVCFTCLQISVHVDSLSQLRSSDQNVLLMIVFVEKILLVTELEHFGLLVVQIVDLLILKIDDLESAVIEVSVLNSVFVVEYLLVYLLGFLFECKKTSLELLFASNVGQNKKFVERFISAFLS